MKNLGVLGSTNGSDLPSIVESINNGNLKGLAKIAIVISNKNDSGILKTARKLNLNTAYLDPRGITREEYDERVSEELDKYNVELITLIGYMKLFGNEFVEKYRNRIMNIHPSLLPSFPGIDKNVHQEVLDAGCKLSGCTLFFVDEGKDTGPIILQRAVPVYNLDDVNSLKTRVQKLEQIIYPEGIRLYALERLKVKGNRVEILK